MTQEQRRHQRFNVVLEGAFSTGAFVCSNSIVNISMGGLCMECGRPIEPGEKVTVIIPTRPPSKVKGKVAWTRKKGLSYLLGIKFGKLSMDQKRAINELINSCFWDTRSR
ncbi:MAG: PilZ domain-containing protein [Thermodesulfobacteria bacterium]|nr:PilZ domain-containing protein [Thermodesulfobacteriota bacterium]